MGEVHAVVDDQGRRILNRIYFSSRNLFQFPFSLQVVVKSLPDTAAVDLDSVLFLEKGSRALGRVFDVFGPVSRPFYAVRFVSNAETSVIPSVLSPIFPSPTNFKQHPYTLSLNFRFNSAKDIEESGVRAGQRVFMAPRTEHTAFVLLGQLLQLKGTDASWKADEEVPSKFQVGTRMDFLKGETPTLTLRAKHIKTDP